MEALRLAEALTYKVFVASVDGEVAQGDGDGAHHLVRVGAEQFHQDRQAFLLAHHRPDVAGPL